MKMKRLLNVISCLVVSLMAWGATYWTPENIPLVYLQDRTKYVSNPDGVLDEWAVDSMNLILAGMEKEKNVQTVVVVVRHIEGDDPYTFGQEVADKYGIGHKGKDDGLYIMLCSEDRSYTILTGEGLEGTLPDAVCRRIQNQVMVPRLKSGDWNRAMLETVKAVSGYVLGDDTLSGAEEEDEAIGVLYGFLAMLIVLVLLMVVISVVSARKCPKCGKRKMMAVRKEVVVVDGKRKHKTTYLCSHCKHQEVRYEDYFDEGMTNAGRGFGGGMMMGGMERGGFGGGGSIGGHFGGGHFGGGGSTGRF